MQKGDEVRQRRILCVEDEEGIREEIVEELEHSGYLVTSAGNGEEALRLLSTMSSCPPDLILSDIRMRDLDGFEFRRRIIRELPDMAGIPFVLLTAFDSEVRKAEDTELGIRARLAKPFDFDDLLAMVGRYAGPP